MAAASMAVSAKDLNISNPDVLLSMHSAAIEIARGSARVEAYTRRCAPYDGPSTDTLKKVYDLTLRVFETFQKIKDLCPEDKWPFYGDDRTIVHRAVAAAAQAYSAAIPCFSQLSPHVATVIASEILTDIIDDFCIACRNCKSDSKEVKEASKKVSEFFLSRDKLWMESIDQGVKPSLALIMQTPGLSAKPADVMAVIDSVKGDIRSIILADNGKTLVSPELLCAASHCTFSAASCISHSISNDIDEAGLEQYQTIAERTRQFDLCVSVLFVGTDSGITFALKKFGVAPADPKALRDHISRV